MIYHERQSLATCCILNSLPYWPIKIYDYGELEFLTHEVFVLGGKNSAHFPSIWVEPTLPQDPRLWQMDWGTAAGLGPLEKHSRSNHSLDFVSIIHEQL